MILIISVIMHNLSHLSLTISVNIKVLHLTGMTLRISLNVHKLSYHLNNISKSHWQMYTLICWYLHVLPVLHRPDMVDIGVNTI